MLKKIIPLFFTHHSSHCLYTRYPNTDQRTCSDRSSCTEPPASDGDAGLAIQEPIETEVPPTKIPPTEKPEPVCATLLTPENGLEVPAVGKVTFAWEPVEGVDSYIFRFTLPTDDIVNSKPIRPPKNVTWKPSA